MLEDHFLLAGVKVSDESSKWNSHASFTLTSQLFLSTFSLNQATYLWNSYYPIISTNQKVLLSSIFINNLENVWPQPECKWLITEAPGPLLNSLKSLLSRMKPVHFSSWSKLKTKTNKQKLKYYLHLLCGPWFTWSLTRIFDTFVWKYFIELGPRYFIGSFLFCSSRPPFCKILCIWFLLRHFASAHKASSGLQNS